MHCDPSHWEEYVDVSQRIQMSKRSFNKAPSIQPSRKYSRHLYLSQFSIFMHDYIEDIVDVKTDENCDFLPIRELHGRDEESHSLVCMPLDGEIFQMYEDHLK